MKIQKAKTYILKGYAMELVLQNKLIQIITDVPIKTVIKIQANKPDIFLMDEIKKKIFIIEVGITSLEMLTKTE